jgi:uncharacterized protein YigE (DUF2233 family)
MRKRNTLFFLLLLSLMPRGYSQTKSNDNLYQGQYFSTYYVPITIGNIQSFELLFNNNRDDHSEVVEKIWETFRQDSREEEFFITNATMVKDLNNCEALGLIIKDYDEVEPINLFAGNGNFFLKPNGVLLIGESDVRIMDSEQVTDLSDARIGIQSGPMLVIDSWIHPEFNSRSKSRFTRSGVGIKTGDKNSVDTLIFSISREPVSFYEFASYFKNYLGCYNALNLESSRSVMEIPGIRSAIIDYHPTCRYLYHKPLEGGASGTGFLVTNDGVIATNFHVIDGAKKVFVRGLNGDFEDKIEADIIVTDMKMDLALLRVPSYSLNQSVIYDINSETQKLGQEVYTLGYPLRSLMGNEVKFTDGKINSLSGVQGDTTRLQISVPIQPGNSGGPLFNSDGEVVGVIVSSLIDAQVANYAVKVEHLEHLMDSRNLKSSTASNVLGAINQYLLSGQSIMEQVKTVQKTVYIIEADY